MYHWGKVGCNGMLSYSSERIGKSKLQFIRWSTWERCQVVWSGPAERQNRHAWFPGRARRFDRRCSKGLPCYCGREGNTKHTPSQLFYGGNFVEKQSRVSNSMKWFDEGVSKRPHTMPEEVPRLTSLEWLVFSDSRHWMLPTRSNTETRDEW